MDDGKDKKGRFQKGHKVNSKGRPRLLPKEIGDVRILTNATFTNMVIRFLYAKPELLRLVAANPDSTNLEQIIAGLIRKAKDTQDVQVINLLLDRILGKVQVNAVISMNNNQPCPMVNFGFSKPPITIDVEKSDGSNTD